MITIQFEMKEHYSHSTTDNPLSEQLATYWSSTVGICCQLVSGHVHRHTSVHRRSAVLQRLPSQSHTNDRYQQSFVKDCSGQYQSRCESNSSLFYVIIGELHSAIGLSLLQARWSGTHYRLSFAICLSVLAFFGILLRRYYSRDISVSSAIEMYP